MKETEEVPSAPPCLPLRNHAAGGLVNNKIYVIGDRLGGAFIFTASNTNVVEECDQATD